jgi:hypothetical protein
VHGLLEVPGKADVVFAGISAGYVRCLIRQEVYSDPKDLLVVELRATKRA